MGINIVCEYIQKWRNRIGNVFGGWENALAVSGCLLQLQFQMGSSMRCDSAHCMYTVVHICL